MRTVILSGMVSVSSAEEMGWLYPELVTHPLKPRCRRASIKTYEAKSMNSVQLVLVRIRCASIAPVRNSCHAGQRMMAPEPSLSRWVPPTYLCGSDDADIPDWIASHQLSVYCGRDRIVVPDNLRAGVSKAHRYEPDINPTYQDMAAHYNVAVVPARVRRPRTKPRSKSPYR